jgi:hypothetical protein
VDENPKVNQIVVFVSFATLWLIKRNLKKELRKNMVEFLLEEKGTHSVHFYCIATEHHRYDLSVIYTNHFFGKAMVVSMQSNTMVLLSSEDIENELYWAEKLGINPIDIDECRTFLRMILQQKLFVNQY